MRILNLKKAYFNRSLVRGLQRIGRGAFACVYGAEASQTVVKITLDTSSAEFAGDCLMQDLKADIAPAAFPKLGECFGVVGGQGEHDLHGYELERLVPVSSPKNRSLVNQWVKGYDASLSSFRSNYPASKDLNRDICLRREHDVAFCTQRIGEGDEFAGAWAVLHYYLSNYCEGVLDMTRPNFMERPDTGELVFSDPVFNLRLAVEIV